MKKVEKYYLDNGGGRDRNSCQVEAGVALLDQRQAEKNKADRGGTGKKTDARVREQRSKSEKLCSPEEGQRDPFLKSRSGSAVSQLNLTSGSGCPRD